MLSVTWSGLHAHRRHANGPPSRSRMAQCSGAQESVLSAAQCYRTQALC